MKINKKLDSFEKNSFFIFITMLIANVCGYAFQIYTGRKLNIDEYGILNTCISLLNIFIIPGAFLSIISSKFTTKVISKDNQETEKKTISALVLMLIMLLCFMGVVYLALANVISVMVGIYSVKYVIICIIASLLVLASSTFSGIIQGMQKYKEYGIQEILLNFCKLIICIGLIFWGLRTQGALLAVLFANLITMIYCFWVIRKSIYLSFTLVKEYINHIVSWLKDIIGISLIRISYLFLLSIDVILVNVYFSEEMTGIYSSAMVVSKIALYLSGAIIVPLFPMVVERKTKGEKTISILLKAILWGEGMALAYSIFLSVFRYFLVVPFFGVKYEKALELIPYTCFYVCGLTLFTILMNYAMASDEIKIFGICSFVNIVVMIVLTYLCHNEMRILIMEMGILVWLFSISFFFIFLSKENRKEKM